MYVDALSVVDDGEDDTVASVLLVERLSDDVTVELVLRGPVLRAFRLGGTDAHRADIFFVLFFNALLFKIKE
jgi:hypothetical protein